MPILQAPAKINLYLAITGRRPDGFHNLVSLAAPLVWGDTLTVEAAASGFTLTCDAPDIPVDGSNLVLKAAAAFARRTGWTGGARFALAKRIPAGSGLGGASSDAVAALEALNGLAGNPLRPAALAEVAASVGSDCALFLARQPVLMRGRGERIDSLPADAYSRLRGMRVFLFKPGFSIATPWAYSRLAADAPHGYVSEARAEQRLSDWLHDPLAAPESLLFNSLERPAFAKYPALPALMERLRIRFNLMPRMTGSGSACFVLLHENRDAAAIEAVVRETWGPTAFMVDTRIA